MAATHFSGPVVSANGFSGSVSGNVSATSVTTVTLTATGAVIFSNLPTADPSVAGQLWSDSGVLTVSAG